MPEIGVRMALGASRPGVVGSFLGRSAVVALAGIAAGIVLTILLSSWLASFLFGVSPTDPLIVAGMAGVVLAACLASTYPPARRAARSDPLEILRRA